MDNDKKTVRRPGRPRSKNTYHDKCDVRLSKKESAMLDRLAQTNEVTKSDVMRMGLRELYRYCTDEEE